MKKGTGKSNPPKASAAKPRTARAATKKKAASNTVKATSKAAAKTTKKPAAKKRAKKRTKKVEYDSPPKSAKEAYLRDLADVLVNAAKPEVVAARALEDETMFLRFEIDGYELAISVADIRMVEGSLEKAQELSKGLRGRFNRIKRPEELTVDQLVERNLPLYWNEEWLRRELARYGSYAELARAHNYPSATTIASYAKRKFGISVQKNFDKKRQAVYDDFETGDYSQLELANKHGVGVATVYRWLADRKPAAARRGRTTMTPEEREQERKKQAKEKAKKEAARAASAA